MGTRKFRQLSIEERCEIARRCKAGESVRKIAAALDRQPSSIAREIARNGGSSGYAPSYASQKARARRWKGSKLLRRPELQARVLQLLASGFSPEAVAGHLKRQEGRTVISHETIYRFIQSQIDRNKNYAWRHYLPRAKSKRGLRGRRGGSPALHIERRVPIAQRPAQFADRSVPGHWEGDTIQFSKSGQVVLALLERSTRLIWMHRLPSKSADVVAQSIASLLAPLPPEMRRSITFDNGTEFALHHRLNDELGISTYFCDPYSPWQKGGVENAIGRLRRYLPRRTDLASLPASQIAKVAANYNYVSRKCLGYESPAEAFSKVLQFKCESMASPRYSGHFR